MESEIEYEIAKLKYLASGLRQFFRQLPANKKVPTKIIKLWKCPRCGAMCRQYTLCTNESCIDAFVDALYCRVMNGKMDFSGKKSSKEIMNELKENGATISE